MSSSGVGKAEANENNPNASLPISSTSAPAKSEGVSGKNGGGNNKKKSGGLANRNDGKKKIVPVIRDTYATPENEAFLKMMEDPLFFIKQKELEARN